MMVRIVLPFNDRSGVQTPASEKLDPEAFATMYEQSRSTLRIVAAGECGFDLADDIVQHGAIVALQRLDQFTPGTNFLAWTSTIVRGVARNQRRSEQRHRSKILRLSSLFPKSGQRNQQITQNTEQTQRPISPDLKLPDGFDDRIRDALDTLTAPQRTCLLMRTLLDHSYSEIGEILEMPAATVRSHVYRSRAALLDLLEESQATEGSER